MISADHAADLTQKAKNSVEKTLKEIVEPMVIDAAHSGSHLVYIPLGVSTFKRSDEFSGLGWYVVDNESRAKRERLIAALNDLGYDVVATTKKEDETRNATFGIVVEW